MKARDIPNLISAARILLTFPVVGLLLAERYGTAMVLYAIAGLSDGIDGFLAKRFGWQSWLGGILDPLADKLLLMACYLTLGWQGLIPAWLVAVVIGRDVVIVVGALAYHYLIARVSGEPSRISKLNTFTQLALVLVVIAAQGVFTIPAYWISLLIYSVLATAILSGLDYVWGWSARAWQQSHTHGEDGGPPR